MPDVYSETKGRLKLTPCEARMIYEMRDKNMEQIARNVGISSSILYRKANGDCSMTLNEFRGLCDGLGMTPREFIMKSKEYA